jgi:hypothetical protein
VTDWQQAGVAVSALVVVGVAWLMLRHWRREWEARLAVLTTLETETARHLDKLVPEQRAPSDPVWWDLVTERGGEER